VHCFLAAGVVVEVGLVLMLVVVLVVVVAVRGVRQHKVS
jgi:hypothetical protein